MNLLDKNLGNSCNQMQIRSDWKGFRIYYIFDVLSISSLFKPWCPWCYHTSPFEWDERFDLFINTTKKLQDLLVLEVLLIRPLTYSELFVLRRSFKSSAFFLFSLDPYSVYSLFLFSTVWPLGGCLFTASQTPNSIPHPLVAGSENMTFFVDVLRIIGKSWI